jgi:hypothetical protein
MSNVHDIPIRRRDQKFAEEFGLTKITTGSVLDDGKILCTVLAVFRECMRAAFRDVNIELDTVMESGSFSSFYYNQSRVKVYRSETNPRDVFIQMSGMDHFSVQQMVTELRSELS